MMTNMTPFWNKLIKNRGILYYLLFIVYLITIHPALLRRVSKASLADPDPLIGRAFILIPLLELVGLWLKFPYLSHETRGNHKEPSSTYTVVIILLPVLHLGMSVFLFIAGTQIAGLQPAGRAAWYWHALYGMGFFLVIFKELGFLTLFLSYGGIEWLPNQRYPPDMLFLRRLRKTFHEFRMIHLLEDILGDLFLLIFSTLAYTALWEYVGLSSPLHADADFWEVFFQVIGLLVYFLIVVPPLQAVFLLRNTMVRTTQTQRRISRLQFGLTLAAAFLSIAMS